MGQVFYKDGSPSRELVEDDDRDHERYGGPVTEGMVHTLLRANSRVKDYDPRRDLDLNEIAKAINSWLVPVSE